MAIVIIRDHSLNTYARQVLSTYLYLNVKEERQKRLEDIEKNRTERMMKRKYLRKMATQQFYKSMQMLQANAKRDKDEPFEDYSIFLYRQTAPDFKDRVKELEQKILYPVSLTECAKNKDHKQSKKNFLKQTNKNINTHIVKEF